MAENKYHFEIPSKNVRIEKYERTGFSQTVPRINHKEHGEKLKIEVLKLKEVEFKKRDSKYTNDLFLQLETPQKIPIKSQKTKIEQLGFEFLSYSPNNISLATAKIEKSKYLEFEVKLDTYIHTEDAVGKTYFAPIENISSISPESKIDENINFEKSQEVDILINLYNALSAKEILAISATITDELKKYSQSIRQKYFQNGINSIHCKIQSKHIPKIISEFSTIKEIKLSQFFFVPQSTPVQSIPSDVKVNPPVSSSIICIVDSGVNNTNGIMNGIVNSKFIYLPSSAIAPCYDHGTFVASRCVFGDEIEQGVVGKELTPYCSIADLTVFGLDVTGKLIGPSDFDLKIAIEEIVTANHSTIKVYNLSLGAPIPVKDFEFSDISKLLDFLSKKYKVLFVISAGNINSLLGSFPADHFASPLSRIGPPAESLLGLTVGSIAKHTNTSALSQLNFVSAFSRKGPGVDLGIKPEVVAHGGNVLKPYDFSTRIAAHGISKDGKSLCCNVGTSHSAPLISQYAQRLFDIYPKANPNLVKALLCHFSDTRYIHEEISDNPEYYVGFGEPLISHAIESHNNNAAFIFEGQLDQDNYQFISFHIPSSLASANPQTSLRIKITITYDPPVNPDNDLEYSESRITASLFKPTHDGKATINISSDDKYLVPWNPILQFEKSFKRSYLHGEWELRLRLYTRGKTIATYMQDFAVVIEIIDENNKTNVYNDILNEFKEIYKRIEIRIAA
ncbi:MAG: S8 family peptidase [Bacteroidetes bacterium]|nr:S8 family peptidase [Bacteroidota bacterium]